MSELANLFSGLDDADVEGRLPKLKDGSYILEVGATKVIKGHNGTAFVIEMSVVESTHAEFRPGRECSATINRLADPKPENRALALGNLKAFLAAAFSDLDLDGEGKKWIDPQSEQNWTGLAMLAAQQETMLRGAKIRVQVDTIDTKGGRKFAKHVWRSLSEPTNGAVVSAA